MKRIFTFIAAALLAVSAQAQLITFTEDAATGTLDGQTFEVDGFKLSLVDENGKMAIDGNNAYFGTSDENQKFSKRLKSGGKSTSKNAMTLTVPAAGTLKIYARTASSSATDRNVAINQNETELYNQIVQDGDAIEVVMGDDDKTTKVYPVISVQVEAGDVDVAYPTGAINFYGFEFVSGTTAIGQVDRGSQTVESGASYNLAGQRVSDSYKGAVIKNGKKHLVK